MSGKQNELINYLKNIISFIQKQERSTWLIILYMCYYPKYEPVFQV